MEVGGKNPSTVQLEKTRLFPAALSLTGTQHSSLCSFSFVSHFPLQNQPQGLVAPPTPPPIVS